MMKERLLIRPTTLGSSGFHWLVLRQKQVISQGYCESFPDTRAEQWQAITQVWLLVPVADVTFREVTLSSRKLPPLAWLVEDALPAQGREVHWAIVNRSGTQATLVGCDSLQLIDWITRLQAIDLYPTHAFPDGLLLPWQPDNITLYAVEDQWWVRFKPWQALCVEHTLLMPVLQRLPLPPPGFNEQFAADKAGMLAFIAPHAADSRVNMLKGLACVHRTPLVLKQIKRATVGLLSVAILSLLLLPLFTGWQEHAARIESEQVLLATWRAYIPTPPPNANPGDAFLTLKQAIPHGFIADVRQVDALLKQTPDVSLQRIEFHREPDSLTLHLSSASDTALETLIQNSRPRFDFIVVKRTAQSVILRTGKLS